MVERAGHSASDGADEWPPRHVPIKPPREVNGFRFVALVNGFDENERPRPWPDRPWVEDPAERDRLVGYLRAGAALNRSDARTYDVFDPHNPKRRWAVPLTYLTDGEWIWSEASVYYLETHRLAPPPEFYDRIVSLGYRCPVVAEETRLRAREALFERGRIEARLRDEYDQQRYIETTPFTLVRGAASNEPPTIAVDPDRIDELANPDHPRFQSDVEIALLDAGWLPGRDTAGRVDPWLADFCSQQDGMGRRHELFPAAHDIYREFGLLDVVPGGFGEEVAAFPIHFFPMDIGAEKVSSHWLAARIGARAFPIAYTDDNLSLLTVDDQGRVYMDHDVGTFFVGAGIEEALDVLLRGLKAPMLESRLDDLRSGRLPGHRLGSGDG